MGFYYFGKVLMWGGVICAAAAVLWLMPEAPQMGLLLFGVACVAVIIGVLLRRRFCPVRTGG